MTYLLLNLKKCLILHPEPDKKQIKTEYNNEKNISTPQQKEKEQAWFP